MKSNDRKQLSTIGLGIKLTLAVRSLVKLKCHSYASPCSHLSSVQSGMPESGMTRLENRTIKCEARVAPRAKIRTPLQKYKSSRSCPFILPPTAEMIAALLHSSSQSGMPESGMTRQGDLTSTCGTQVAPRANTRTLIQTFTINRSYPLTPPSVLQYPSCDAQNLFWHKRDTAG